MQLSERKVAEHFLLVIATCAAVALGACGGGGGGPPAQTPRARGTGAPGTAAPGTASPPSSSGGASTPSPATPAGNGSAAAATVDPSASTKTPSTVTGEPRVMRGVEATQLAAALKDIGLDAKNLPPLNKVPPDKIRKVMSTFTKALGTPCTGCHDADDFKKATPNKKIASRMWNELVRGYAIEGGGAVYCDSCHAGKMEFLVRDPGMKGLSAWMDANFVAKLKRVDGASHGCETCHGDPFDGKILKSWATAKTP